LSEDLQTLSFEWVMRTRDGHAFGKVLMMGSVSWFPSTVWQLMGKYRRRGAMADGLVEASVEGTPQGGRLSPLLANIYLERSTRSGRSAGTAFADMRMTATST
jgi:hypothetical protein